MAPRDAWSDEQLAAAVRGATSFIAVLRALGAGVSSGTYLALRARIETLGLDTSHFVARSRALAADVDLRAAVAASTSYAMVLARLGLADTPANYERIKRRIYVLAIDRSHFAPVPRSRKRTAVAWTDDQLRDAVRASVSIAQVIRRLGLVPEGGNYVQTQRRIRELELDTSHLTRKAWNAGWKFDPRPHRPLDELLVTGSTIGSHALKLRLFKAGLKHPACERCGWAARAPDGRIPVELDHANGDRTDNRLENLRILCPNCHALEPTHRGLNQARARRK